MPSRNVPAGIKLAVRADRPNGVIRAYFSTMDDAERFEAGTLCIGLADESPELFDAWVGLMRSTLKAWVQAHAGVEVAGFEVFRPHDKN